MKELGTVFEESRLEHAHCTAILSSARASTFFPSLDPSDTILEAKYEKRK